MEAIGTLTIYPGRRTRLVFDYDGERRSDAMLPLWEALKEAEVTVKVFRAQIKCRLEAGQPLHEDIWADALEAWGALIDSTT